MESATLQPKIVRTGRSRTQIAVILIAALVALAVVLVAIASAYAGRLARRHLVDAIEKHYRAKVGLDNFTVLVFPRVVIHGENLALRRGEQQDGIPFIAVERFTAEASILDLLRKRKRIDLVKLEGLRINIGNSTEPKSREDSASGSAKLDVPDFVINQVSADGTKLTIIPDNPKKDPLIFDIQKLYLKSAGNFTSMNYTATLTNATPPGLIHSQGRFGPINGDDIGKTPLGGKYQFRDADLSVFKGISGKLSSDGEFIGVLENIVVDGNTAIPDFQVRNSGHPVEMKTQFHAIVDGTNGDTTLEPVNVSFGNSNLTARGKVDGVPGQNGKAVSLTVDTQSARVEDLVSMVVSGEPILRGAADFHTSFVLSPGHADVLDRLQLRGNFGLEQTQFLKNSLQEKIAKLSNTARGKDHAPIPASDTASNFHGNFTLENGVAKFTDLRFDVPGAQVSLAGNYDVDHETLDFRGHLVMDAKLSQMTTGVKSFFAKLVQPLVTKHDDTVIPIKITGTKDNPKFGVEIGKLLKRQ